MMLCLLSEKLLPGFREHGLKLKQWKCHFFKEEVEYLARLVSGSGLSSLPDKFEAVK